MQSFKVPCVVQQAAERLSGCGRSASDSLAVGTRVRSLLSSPTSANKCLTRLKTNTTHVVSYTLAITTIIVLYLYFRVSGPAAVVRPTAKTSGNMAWPGRQLRRVGDNRVYSGGEGHASRDFRARGIYTGKQR
jgi:hypothetical protein